MNKRPDVLRLQVAVELYRSGGALSAELEQTIKQLRTADGEALPTEVTQLLIDLLYGRAKPRAGRAVSPALVRESFRRVYERMKADDFFSGVAVPAEKKQAESYLNGDRPRSKGATKKSAEDERYLAVVAELARHFMLAEYTIQTYINGSHKRPRSNYKPKKPAPK